ncbi:MAG: ATP-binding protein [bacterium]
MIIKDFILQGIRGFKDPVRFQLVNGLNAILGDNEKGKTTIAEALFFLFYVENDKDKRQKLRNEAAKDVRLGVTFQDGPDSFRLLMDLVSDAVLLSKYNPEAKKFIQVSKDANEIKEFFKRELLFKPFDAYRDLYLINHYDLLNIPVVSAQQANPSEAPFLGNAIEGTFGEGELESSYLTEEDRVYEEREDMNEEEIKAEISRLEKELQLAGDTSKKQEQIDQLESELANIQNKIKELNARKLALQEIENQVNELNKFSDLPDDIESKLDDYIRFEEKIKKDIENIERQKSQYETINIEIPPFYRDRLFITGAGCTILFIIISIVLSVYVGTWGMYVSSGVFIGLGLMGYTLWKDAVKRGKIKEKKEKIINLEKQIKEQRNKYEIEGSVIKSIISSMKLDSAEALREGIKRYKTTLDKFAQAKAMYNQAITENNLDLLQKQEEKLKADINALQEEIRVSLSSSDPYTITQRIDTLKNKLLHINEVQPKRKNTALQQPLKKPLMKNDVPKQESMAGFMKRIDILKGLTGEQKDRIVSIVLSQAGAHFKDLTQGRYVEIQIINDTIFTFTNLNKQIEFDSLSDSIKEKCLLSILIAISEYTVEKWPWSMVIDEPFISIDSNNKLVVYNKIKALSKETQIIFLTKDKNLKSFADNTILLP